MILVKWLDDGIPLPIDSNSFILMLIDAETFGFDLIFYILFFGIKYIIDYELISISDVIYYDFFSLFDSSLDTYLKALENILEYV